MLKIVSIVGARPNFIKIAPILRELGKRFKGDGSSKKIESLLIHTGQHFDFDMSDLFFRELQIKKPDIYLGVGSGTHAVQTGKVMIALEKALQKLKPDLVIVAGDVNSTLAAALVASKLHIPLAHVEAGLRSFDKSMPEEVNRKITDSLSDYLFSPSADANLNLKKEGIPESKIFFVGNVMIDSLKLLLPKAKKLEAYKKYGLNKKGYCLLTLHRPSNVDNKILLGTIINSLIKISGTIPIIFPVHPRTRKALSPFPRWTSGESYAFIPTQPLGYLENLSLMMNSKFVITDSGGIQEETTVLKIPCLTLRKNTERPVTVSMGTNTVIGTDMSKLFNCVNQIMKGKYKNGKTPKLWDGHTAKRIVNIIKQHLDVETGL